MRDYTVLFADEMRKLSTTAFVDKFGIAAKQIDPFGFASRLGVAVAVEKEFAVGFISKSQLIAALFVPETAPDCFSFDIAVAPEFRGQGLASLLVDFAEAIFHEMSSTVVHMSYCIVVINEDMKNILERKGFRVYKTIKRPESSSKSYLMTK